MSVYRYVKLDPTGNTTCLVLDQVNPEEENALTRKLLRQCEQVAYLQAPSKPGAAAAVRLMGGEFCGNAAMAAAAWIIREEAKADIPMSFLLEVSGAEEPVRCTIRKKENGFEGTVEMPGIPEIREECFFGIPFTAVRMEGIVHLIYEEGLLEREQAENLLQRIVPPMTDEAVGLLQWNRKEQKMLPLVYVRGSNSLVWEHGCGSGSAAVGALEAFRNGTGEQTIAVSQPGGIIRVTTEAENGEILSVKITGQIFPGNESVIEM